MIIYEQEQHLEKLITASNRILSEAILIETDITVDDLLPEAKNFLKTGVDNDKELRAVEEIDSKDLMPVSAILCSSIWNKNHDIIIASEIINKFATAKFKPINWEHKGSEAMGNENIGVIVASQVLKGPLNNLTSFDFSNDSHLLSDLSGQVHLKTDGLIWKSYFPTYVEKITEGRKKGKLFVSVEAFFDDFGYGLRESEGGPIKLIDRNKSNAHLTSNLKIYSGTGIVNFEGKKYQIGRWVRDVTFSGQGMVSNPANKLNDKPLSIILNSVSTDNKSNICFDGNWHHPTYIIPTTCPMYYPPDQFYCGESPQVVYKPNSTDLNGDFNKMAESDTLKAQLDKVISERDELVKRLAEFENDAMQAKIEGLMQEVAELKAEKDKLDAANTSNKSEIAKLDALKAELETLKGEKETLHKEVATFRANETARLRLSELVNEAKGFKVPYSEKDLPVLAEMTEETFEAIKDAVTRAGVSSLPQKTEQTVSGEPKLTEQTVSNETKLTQASEVAEVSDEAAEKIKAAASTEEVVIVETKVENDKPRIAQTLVKNIVMRRK